jgi:hypothetical protein
MLKEEHTIVGSRPKIRKRIFFVDKFKATFENKIDGRIKEDKLSAATPRSDGGGEEVNLMYPFFHEE